MFRASLNFSFIPLSWRETTVTFIPKAGKASYDKANSFRPISLMSFVLKTLEKLVERRIREKTISENSFDKSQHAYQAGKDTNTALHELVTELEKNLSRKQTALTVFIDIAGAFNCTTFASIGKAAEEKGVENWASNWIKSMLENRVVRTLLDSGKLRFNPTKGCPQGGCSSPLLWCLVIDPLIKDLKEAGFKVTVYADDLAVTVTGHSRLINEIRCKMNQGLKLISEWCERNGLSVNPEKTYAMRFTGKEKGKYKLGKLKLNGIEIKVVDSIKYLGIMLDNQLSWGKQVDYAIEKGRKTLWASKRMVSVNWGLKPKYMMWIFNQIVLPRVTYGCLVWWQISKLKNVINKFNSLQRTALMTTTGATRNTPTLAMMALFNVSSFEFKLKAIAMRTCARIKKAGWWRQDCPMDTKYHGYIQSSLERLMLNDHSDKINPVNNYNNNLASLINDRKNWSFSMKTVNNPYCWFSDGSKRDDKAAFGIFNPALGISKSIRISDHATIMQAEMKAIEECVVESIRRNFRCDEIVILTDSQAAIKALRKGSITSKTTLDCLKRIKFASDKFKVKVAWVPGHSGIDGNERADLLANVGIDRPDIGRIVPIAETLLENRITDWERNVSLTKWRESEEMLHSKRHINGYDKKLAKDLLNMERTDLRRLVGFLTGHSLHKSFLFKIGKSETDMCRYCWEDEEKMAHLIYDCPAFTGTRRIIFGAEIINEQMIKSAKLKTLLEFIKKTKMEKVFEVIS
jgi:ribonuclease HI